LTAELSGQQRTVICFAC